MTEKRFFILTDDEYDTRPCIRDRTFKIQDIYGDYKYDDLNEICNELNRLNDENEQLKSKNRGLQSELQIFKEDVTHSNLQINKLTDENEQLKQQVKRLQHWNKCLAEKRHQELKGDVE